MNINRLNINELDMFLAECETDFNIGHIGIKKKYLELIYSWGKKKRDLFY